jgi:biotin carboxyl carrier protein
MRYNLSIGDQKYEVEVGEIVGDALTVQVNGAPYEVVIENPEALKLTSPSPQAVATSPPAAVPSPKPAAPVSTPAPALAAASGDGVVLAPIPGQILDIKIRVGETVQAGQTVATMEAMKMENNIVSNIDGTVQEIRVQKDSEVATGDVIMVVA